MDYKRLMKKISCAVTQIKNYPVVVQRMKSALPDNLMNSLKYYIVPGGAPGSGAGKGGGAGGSIRESGGGLGRYGAAQEEGYFFQKQREQLKRLKDKLTGKKDVEVKQKAEK